MEYLGIITRLKMRSDTSLYNETYQEPFTSLVLTIIYDCLESGKHAAFKGNHFSNFCFRARPTSIALKLANANSQRLVHYRAASASHGDEACDDNEHDPKE